MYNYTPVSKGLVFMPKAAAADIIRVYFINNTIIDMALLCYLRISPLPFSSRSVT